MTIEEVNQKIRSAFADVPYPGDDNLGHPDGRDDGERVTETLRGRTWQSLQPRELWSEALHFMTPAAFHYYFPAFLLAQEAEDNGDYNDGLFDEIEPPLTFTYLKNDQLDEFVLKYQDFTAPQKQAIAYFVEYRYQEQLRFYNEVPELGGMDSFEEQEWQRLREYWGSF